MTCQCMCAQPQVEKEKPSLTSLQEALVAGDWVQIKCGIPHIKTCYKKHTHLHTKRHPVCILQPVFGDGSDPLSRWLPADRCGRESLIMNLKRNLFLTHMHTAFVYHPRPDTAM